MILFTDRTADNLYRGVLAEPDNDLQRLVLADRLEEIRQAEWAEFIRLNVACPDGVEIPFPVKQGPVWQRIWQLIGPKVPRDEWFGTRADLGGAKRAFRHPLDQSVGPVVVVGRGFPEEVRAPLAWLRGGECTGCDGTGHELEGTQATGRGCPACQGTGRTPGHLAELVRKWPIQRVVVPSRRPAASWDSSRQACWHDGGHECGEIVNAASLPTAVFRALAGGFIANTVWRVYESQDAAMRALSDALLAEAREAATPPAP